MTSIDKGHRLPGHVNGSFDNPVNVALQMHISAVRIYEHACNARAFNFDTDLDRFMAADVTVVLANELGDRSLLADTLEARADYVRTTRATVTIDVKPVCVAQMESVAMIVTNGDVNFAFPDWTAYRQRVLLSSAVRFVDSGWVFQHLHFGGNSCW